MSSSIRLLGGDSMSLTLPSFKIETQSNGNRLTLGNVKDMESPPHNLIELLIFKLQHFDHFQPFSTIFDHLLTFLPL